MRIELVVPLLVATGLLFSGLANADVIWLVGEEDPVYGILESSNGNSILFRRTTDGKEYETVSFDRNSIESIVTNFDVTRLELLAPDDWKSWREYSEELTSQKQDPVARNLAMRLLVVVAGNSRDMNQRSAALTDLISLARNADERKRLIQLRYLETGIRQPVQTEGSTVKMLQPNDRSAAIDMVRAIRNGEDVSELILNAELKQTVEAFADVCSWEELVQISKSNRVGDLQLRQLVALEFRLRNYEATQPSEERPKSSWYELAGRTEKSSLSLPTISTVTEFNPNHTRFVDGKWLHR